MAEINGENLTQGRAGAGAAFLLPSRTPEALSILRQGEAARAKMAQQQAERRARQDAQTAKEYRDDVKYKQDGSVYFAEPLNEKVYKPTPGLLQEVYKRRDLDAMGRQEIVRPIKQRVDNETAQSAAKTAAIKETLGGFQRDNALYNPQYAAEHLTKALRNEDGSRRLPSEFDEEAWRASLLGDANAYNEKEVVTRTAKGLFPIISQKIAEAGQLGGEHTANQVRGRLVAFDGKGHARLNADGTPVMNLTADTDNLLDSDPLFKLQTDKRVAAYEKARAENIEARKADPSIPELPVMTRRGHHATMLGPLAYYEQSHDEGLNAQIPHPRAAAKVSPNKVVASDYVGARQSDYQDEATGTTRTNHYAEVGQTFGSATKPYVEVSAPTARLTIIGQDGQPTKTNQVAGGGNTKVMAQARVYALYTKTGKRLGRPEPFATDQEAADYTLDLVRKYPKPQDLELRVEGRGTLEDDQRVAGDGLGGGVPMVYKAPTATSAGGMVPDNSVRKTARTVLFPITQEIDDQFSRVTGGEWNRFKHSKAQAELMREVQKRGGKFVGPYTSAKREAEQATKPKPQRPAFLQPATGKKTNTKPTNTNNTAADNSGGML